MRRVARALGRRLPRHVDQDDLYGAACLGLAEALSKVPASDGSGFEAYVMRRVRGAVADHLRASDVLSRKQRVELARIHDSAERLRDDLARPPRVSEIASAAGVTEERCVELLVLAEGRGAARANEADKTQSAGDDPETLVGLHLELGRIESARVALAARQNRILDLYYEEDLSQSEIARRLSLSEARVSQLRRSAIERLRELREAC